VRFIFFTPLPGLTRDFASAAVEANSSVFWVVTRRYNPEDGRMLAVSWQSKRWGFFNFSKMEATKYHFDKAQRPGVRLSFE
jgi:hypothetical protein